MICLVAGARPNFMKVAPLIRALKRRGCKNWFLVHTGQHYDAALSDVFFRELDLPKPDVWLGVGSGTHAEQTARVMMGIEAVCRERRPTDIVVVGDVNSTMAAAVVAAKAGVRLSHVEAGLRSGDRSMPEEINRLITDVLADLLFTTSRDANENLRREGIALEKIHFVGNVMVDSLLTHLQNAKARDTLVRLRLVDESGTRVRYAVVTMHRPSNVDASETFAGLMRAVEHVAMQIPVVFPVHPRTAERARAIAIKGDIRIIEPLGYLDFLALTSNAALILTDSGGLQEESTILHVPCVTMRENTERPVTIECGTNVLAGTSSDRIISVVDAALAGPTSQRVPPLWDGHAAERIVDVLLTSQ